MRPVRRSFITVRLRDQIYSDFNKRTDFDGEDLDRVFSLDEHVDNIEEPFSGIFVDLDGTSVFFDTVECPREVVDAPRATTQLD